MSAPVSSLAGIGWEGGGGTHASPASISGRIGKYELQVALGKSALLKMFRATDPDTARPVTLKVLTGVTERPLLDRFRREVAIIANVRHRNVIAVYELGEHVGFPFAAMQHLAGGDLRQAIDERRPLTLLQKMHTMSQVAQGVQAAYSGGLAYVGLRPSAIALDGEGNVTIQDFGMVRLDSTPDGPLAYRAPEEVGEFSPDALCDIFAYGAIYYELLAGVHPFAGAAPDGPAPLRDWAPDCPEALERLVFRALEKHRDLRWQSFDDLQDEAEPILRELKRGRAADLVADARQLLDSEQVEEAQRAIREILDLDPDNREAHQLRALLRRAMQRSQVQPRIESLLREAEEEAAARRFPRAAEILKTVLRLDEDSAEARIRLELIAARVEQSRAVAQLVSEARQLLECESFSEAREKAAEAFEADPDRNDARELLRAIADAVERRAREARIERGLEEAKSLLLLQAFDQALALLEDLRAEFPESELIAHWHAHGAAQKVQAERQTRLETNLLEGGALLRQGQSAAAVALLTSLCREFPDEPRVAGLLASAREAMERTANVRQEVGWLLDQDRPDLALHFLREKTAESSEDPELLSQLASVESLLPDWEKRRLVKDALARADSLEEVQQPSLALAVLEEASQNCPESRELAEAAGRLRELLREQDHRKRLSRRVELIGQKIAAEAWPQALLLLESAQAEFPGEPEVQALADQVRAWSRRAQCEAIAAEVRQALADGQPEAAAEILRKGLDSFGNEPALLALHAALDADHQFREQLKRAQVCFGRRQFQQAEEILAELAVESRPEAQALLETVRAARASSEEDQFYNRGREKALKLLKEQQAEAAVDLLRNLLCLFPGDPILERDFETARARAAEAPPAVVVPVPAVEANRPEPGPRVALPQPVLPAFATAAQPAQPRVPRAAIAGSALLFLAAGGAAFFKSGRHDTEPTAVSVSPPKPAPAHEPPAAPIKPAVSNGPVAVSALTEPPQRGLAPAPAAEPPASTPAPPSPRPFSPPAITQPIRVAAAPVIPPPPGTAVLVIGREPAGVPANVLSPASVPPPAPARNQTATETPAAPPFGMGGNIQPPRVISHPTPAIPAVAKSMNLYGTVKLEASVDKDGKVTKVDVLQGNAILAAAARQAVMHWRYQPATLNGQPTDFQVQIQVAFERGQ